MPFVAAEVTDEPPPGAACDLVDEALQRLARALEVSLRLVEQFLRALEQRGFSDEQAVRGYRSFTTFLLGHLLLETAAHQDAGSGTSDMLDGVLDGLLGEGGASVPNRDGRTSADGYPTLQRLRPLLTQDHTEEEFERALEGLLDRMDRWVSQ